MSSVARTHHPVVARHLAQRGADAQLRLADRITAFAGSMTFVYLHVVGFAVWMLAVERHPWPALTLVVSLEAIFLSSFVMIGQNRQAAFQQEKADHDFLESEVHLRDNTALTTRIYALTVELGVLLRDVPGAGPVAAGGPRPVDGPRPPGAAD